MTEKEFIAKLKRFRHVLPKQTVKNVMDMAHRQTKVFVKHFGCDDYKGQFICSLKEAHNIKRIVRGA